MKNIHTQSLSYSLRCSLFSTAARRCASLIAVSSMATLLSLPAAAQGKQPRVEPVRYTGDILVKWRDDAEASSGTPRDKHSTDKVLTLASATGLPLTLKRPLSGKDGTLVAIKGLHPAQAPDVAAALAQDPRVAAAEPDRWLRPVRVPNDPGFSSQTALHAPVGALVGGANLPAAWDRTTGSTSIVVAVIDTGVLPHPDLQTRLLPGYDFIAEVARANDGDGRDGNAADAGDGATVAECSSGSPGVGVDGNSWHGTRVAGVVGALTNNGTDIAGVDWAARILPVRVSGKCGARLSDVLDGMRWAAGLSVGGVPDNPTPARVLNISLGGGSCSSFEQQAINDVAAVGALVVAAAGNNAGAPEAPGNCSGVISVTAHVENGDSAHYASVGPEVTISAPGGGCPTMQTNYSGGTPTCASPSTMRTLSNSGNTPGSYIVVDSLGTSFAAPVVSGVASMMLAINPGLTPAQIIEGMRRTARPHPAGTYCTTAAGNGTCGAGLLDASAAVAYAQNPGGPSTPGGGTGGGTGSGGGGGGGGALSLVLSAALLLLGVGACAIGRRTTRPRR